MTQNSGFKVVAIVAVLSIVGVVVIDRLVDTGAFSAFSQSRVNEAVPQVPDKAQQTRPAGGRRSTTKHTMSTSLAVEVAPTDVSVGLVDALPMRHEALQRNAVGMDRSQIIAVFGLPTLRVIETSNSKVVERFIYIDRDRHTRTVTVLENGRAVRSRTEQYLGSK